MAGFSSKNVPLFGVSSRTRSKNVPLFGSLLLGGSSKRRKSDEEDKGLEYVSGSKRRKMNEEPFVVPADAEVVSIDDDEYEDVGQEGLEHSDEKMSEGGVASGGSGDFDAEIAKFVDEKCDRAQDNPIPISSDEYGESDEELSVDSDANNEEEEKENEDYVVKEGVKSDESDGTGRFSDKGEKVIIDLDDSEESEEDEEDSDESEANDSSDEDFVVDEPNEISDNDDNDCSSSSSYVDDDDDAEEEEKKKEGYRKDFNVVEELVRKVKSKKSGISESNNGEVNVENSSSYGNDDEEMVRKGRDKKSGISERKCEEVENENRPSSTNTDKLDHADHASVSSSTYVKKGSSSKLNGVSETLKAKSVDVKVKNVSDESVNVGANAKSKDNVGDSDQGKDQYVGLDVGGVSSVQTKQENEVLWDELDEALRESEAVSKNEMSEGKIAKSVNVAKAKFKPKKYEEVEKELEHADHASVSSCTIEKKGSSSSKPNGVSETLKPKSVEGKVKNLFDESVNIRVNAKSKNKSKENVGDSDRGKDQFVKGGLNVGGVSSVQKEKEEMKESDKQKTMENKRRDYKGRANICNGEKKESIDNNGLNQGVKSTHFMRKELRSLELLVKCYWERKNTMNNDSIVLEVNDDGVGQQDTRPPPVSVETPCERIWSLKKVEKVQKTKEEEEEELLWDEFDTVRRESDAESMIGNLGENGGSSSRCEHDTFLDEEIGLFCKLCHEVVTEIKYISPAVDDRCPNEGSGKRASFDDSVNASLFDGSQFNVSDGDSDANLFLEGTVWDLIPDVKEKLYPHQQEGFEFIWKNLAGNIELQKLKNADPRREGGCIISHAPGTGKTRLTIEFLKAYLKVFPRCLPIIVAPASLLLTWEYEFKKWDIGVPFHNLNNSELSVKEHDDVVNANNWSNTRQSTEETRMMKLISWFKDKSILGISYSLYEKIAGGGESEDGDGKKRKHASADKRKENSCMRKVLLETPGLLVLDEGHTPRNKNSLIWKVLSKIQTRKRIILSGTPFQNNFLELYNTLSLVRPSFHKTIPHELKKFCQKQEHKKAPKEWSWEPVLGNTAGNTSDDKIKQLKLLMDPFVHVHKGAILQKKLPGLRDCVLCLKPDSFHKQILESFKSSQNSFIFENKQTLASIHPSLLLECKLLEEEESFVDKDHLEKLRLDHNAGVKTKFLVEFVSLCAAHNEKVLVFSQFLDPLRLIIDQLNSALKWTEGKEILYMSGEVRDRQSLIHNFNDENSQSKILLASTRACSEGISLVGASRVVLLDVEWNPSVEKQAVSRAYRIGQKKVVYTYHLLTQGTKEYDKYCKQAEKHRLSELVFSAKNADNHNEPKNCAADIEDRILDLMIRHENLKDMFVECVVQPKEREFESFDY